MSDHLKTIIERVAERSNKASKSLVIFLGVASYASLAALSVSDQDIVFGRGATLPLVNVNVGLEMFFIVLPVILVLSYLHFQVYLLEYKEEYDNAVNQLVIDELASLPTWYVSIGQQKTGTGSRFKTYSATLLGGVAVWLSLPVALNIALISIVRLHSDFLSYWTAIWAIGGTVVAFVVWILYNRDDWKDVFENHVESSRHEPIWKRRLRVIRGCAFKGFPALLITLSCVVAVLITSTISDAHSGWPKQEQQYSFVSRLIRPYTILYLQNELIVSGPRRDYRGRMWGNFKGRRFEGANMVNCVFESADLTGAKFNNAVLNYSYFMGIDADDADFTSANLRGAKFQQAELERAKFEHADISDAVFDGAIINAVDFRFSKGVSENQFRKVRSWIDAKFPSIVESIGDHYAHGVQYRQEAYMEY